ncbi:MAG: SUMF1/EgtB/PvdO family nonheme iron enzyme [Kiritimatiellae bacterium]|nr:SUMF1/EgtB/PvdO family nonheme iron enzyme [Kiritimatiellia bacterium]
MKKILMVAALAAMGAGAAPVVEITSVQQQYPWTNTVDITYTSTGIAEENTYYVVFKAYDAASKEIGVITNDLKVSQGSTWVAQWQPPFNVRYENCSMIPYVYKGGMDDYMVIDLETWQVTYEPMSTQIASNEKYNTDEYKTKKLVLRKVEGDKSYQIGYNETGEITRGNYANTRHSTFVPADYYLTIFPVTEGQYRRIMGDTSYADTNLPVVNLSWNTIRGSAGVMADPTSTCVFVKLKARLEANGFDSGAGFDLPTESMWEVAARAGVLTRYIWGDTTTGWEAYTTASNNSKASRQVPGLLRPNAWGFYDMIGNVWDITRDLGRNTDLASISEQAQNAFTPFLGGAGQLIIRLGGGSPLYNAIDTEYYRISTVYVSDHNNSASVHISFRIAWHK